MREAALPGISRRNGPSTTPRDPQRRPGLDLVHRRFTADPRSRLWLADISYVPTQPGFPYLPTALDAFSPRMVASSRTSNLRTDPVFDPLKITLSQPRPRRDVPHSDQGSHYTSSARGDCSDNAMAERLIASLECQLIDRTPFPNPGDARRELFPYIKAWYKPRPRNSGIGHESPANLEKTYRESPCIHRM